MRNISRGAKFIEPNLRGTKSFKGCEIFLEKIKGFEKLLKAIKGSKNFEQFSKKYSDRVSGVKNDPPKVFV